MDVTVYLFLVLIYEKWMCAGIMSTGRFLIWTFGNRLNACSYSVEDWILCMLLYFVNLNFIMVYIEPITQLWRNVFLIFGMILGSESCVWTHRRRLSVWGTGAKFSWTHRRRKGSVVGGTMASAEHEPIMGVWGQKPPEAESIWVIGCPMEPANLAPLVIFSK